jgi:hypothetical protein
VDTLSSLRCKQVEPRLGLGHFLFGLAGTPAPKGQNGRGVVRTGGASSYLASQCAEAIPASRLD